MALKFFNESLLKSITLLVVLIFAIKITKAQSDELELSLKEYTRYANIQGRYNPVVVELVFFENKSVFITAMHFLHKIDELKLHQIAPTHIATYKNHKYLVRFQTSISPSNLKRLPEDFQLEPFSNALYDKTFAYIRKNKNKVFDGVFASRLVCFNSEGLYYDIYMYSDDVSDACSINKKE